jgi:peptidoglycan/xylan/chitin deacetylase (PgdA/CDA1 family)
MRRQFILFTFLLVTAASCIKPAEPVPSKEGRILILMYHRLVTGDATNLYERSVKDFESDLKYLADNGIKVICFDDLEKIAASGKMPPGNSAIITFDDGDHSWYTLALPLLLQYKMKATFFIIADMIGHDSFLTWEEVELMSRYMYPGDEKSFIFGSHSFSHQFLLQRKEGFSTDAEYNSFLDYELGVSKSLIESHTGQTVTTLSLPFGDGEGDEEIITAVKRNGYKCIRTSRWAAIESCPSNLFTLPGLPILDATPSAFIGSYFEL